MPLSFDTVALFRWARTAAGVNVTDGNEVAEPPGASKDTGFTDGGGSDTFVREWHNWMLQTLGVNLEYLLDKFEAHGLGGPQVARLSRDTSGASVSGTSGSTTVTAHQAIVGGRHFVVAETVVAVPVQATLTVMNRIIVDRLIAGVMTLVLVDGVAEATDPTLNTGDIPIARIVQNNGDANYTLESLVEYGRSEVGELLVDDALEASANGPSVFRGDWQIADPVSAVDGSDLGAVPRYDRVHISSLGMVVYQGTPAKLTLSTTVSAGESLVADVQLPPGAVITQINVTGQRSSDATAEVLLEAINRTDTVRTLYVRSSIDLVGAGTFEHVVTAGDVTLAPAADAFPYAVGPDDQVRVEYFGITDSTDLFVITIEFEHNNPFRGWPKL